MMRGKNRINHLRFSVRHLPNLHDSCRLCDETPITLCHSPCDEEETQKIKSNRIKCSIADVKSIYWTNIKSIYFPTKSHSFAVVIVILFLLGFFSTLWITSVTFEGKVCETESNLTIVTHTKTDSSPIHICSELNTLLQIDGKLLEIIWNT